MFLGFTNKKISNNHKLLSHNNLSIFEGKFTPLFFWNNEPQPPALLWSGRDPVMINQKQFILLSFGKREKHPRKYRCRGWILGKNSAGHCFVLSDLIAVNFFKWSWNEKYALQPKFLVKVVSKNYQSYLFSKYEVCNQERDRATHDACCLRRTILDASSWNRLAVP